MIPRTRSVSRILQQTGAQIDIWQDVEGSKLAKTIGPVIVLASSPWMYHGKAASRRKSLSTSSVKSALQSCPVSSTQSFGNDCCHRRRTWIRQSNMQLLPLALVMNGHYADRHHVSMPRQTGYFSLHSGNAIKRSTIYCDQATNGPKAIPCAH